MSIATKTYQFAQLVIAAEVKKLCLRGTIHKHEEEDFASELMTRLIAAWPKYDSTRASPEAFVNQVVNTQLISILRERYAQKRRGPATALCSLIEPLVDAAAAGLEEQAIDLRLDLRIALSRLNPRQLQIVDKLGREGVSPVAKQMGVPRRTLRDECERIKVIFKDAGLEDYL